LAKAADTLNELRERYDSLVIDDRSRTFNTELTTALELSHLLDVADCILASASTAGGVPRRPSAAGLSDAK
jgi:fumarate reductase flavoprotein subunit